MGLGKLIYYAVVGPLALMLLLHGYTFCRHFIQTPKPVSIRSFPGTMDAAAKDLVINSRKPIIKDLLAMYQGKLSGTEVAAKRLAPSFEFEDPLGLYQGAEEFNGVLKVFRKIVSNVEFTIHGEHHGPNEILLDYTMHMKLNLIGSVVPLRLRVTVSLDPTNKPGQEEKIVRITEEFNGNKLITEQNSGFGMAGKVQQMFRRFNGWAAASFGSKYL